VFEADLRTEELRKQGQRLRLPSQSFQVLRLLLERPGELVSREELRAKLWPADTFVDFDHGLNAAVNRLREALGDSADSPRFVETLPRRGYRFIGPVEGCPPVNASSKPVLSEGGRRQKLWLTIGVAVILSFLVAAWYGAHSFLTSPLVPFENFTISEITSTGNLVDAAISPDGKFLLNEVDVHGKLSLWLRNISTNSDTLVISPSEATYCCSRFSPDGNYIYFRRLDDVRGAEDLVRTPVLGGTPQVIVRDIQSNVTFSPDGKRIACLRLNRPEAGKFRLLTLNADGSDEMTLTTGTLHAAWGGVAWSPDGNQIALTFRGYIDELSGIQVVDIASARMRTLGRFKKQFFDLAWLPDSRNLLVTYEDDSSPHQQIGLISNPDGQFRTVTRDANDYEGLTLSANGKTLATLQQKASQTLYLMPATGFTGEPPKPAPAQNRNSFTFGWAVNGDLYFDGHVLLQISTDGSNERRLFSDSTGQIIGPESCSNGQYVVFGRTGYGESNKVSNWRVDADGSNPKQLTSSVSSSLLHCSPDSKWAYYYDFDTVQMERVRIDGGAPEVVPGTAKMALWSNLAISPDGKLLAFLTQRVGSSEVEPPRIALVNLDLGPKSPSQLLELDNHVPGRAGSQLRFTPDSKSVVYPILENDVNNLWLQPLDGSRGHEITDFRSDGIVSYRYSPDGKTLGVMLSHVEAEVVLLRDVGSSPN
jgi:DNA-binding winged helix-turn-helix (wHTH) protein/Tol biopolymer transport system component